MNRGVCVFTSVLVCLGLLGSCQRESQTSDVDFLPAVIREEIDVLLDPVAYTTAYNSYTDAFFDAIATCMGEAGHSYFTPNGVALPVPIEDSLDNREVRGLGFLPPVGDYDDFGGTDQIEQELNEQEIGSLSDLERDAWLSTESQCSQRAEEATDRLRPGDSNGTEAERAVAEAQEWAAGQPAFVNATAAWQSCMAEDGFLFRDQVDMREAVIRDQVANDYRNMWAQAVYDARLEGADLPQLDFVFTPEQRNDLASRQDRERSIAIRDWECGRDLAAVTDELVQAHLSQRFE